MSPTRSVILHSMLTLARVRSLKISKGKVISIGRYLKPIKLRSKCQSGNVLADTTSLPIATNAVEIAHPHENATHVIFPSTMKDGLWLTCTSTEYIKDNFHIRCIVRDKRLEDLVFF